MNLSEYHKARFTNCPKCHDLPAIAAHDGRRSWLVCERCRARWQIADHIDDAKQCEPGDLAGFQELRV